MYSPFSDPDVHLPEDPENNDPDVGDLVDVHVAWSGGHSSGVNSVTGAIYLGSEWPPQESVPGYHFYDGIMGPFMVFDGGPWWIEPEKKRLGVQIEAMSFIVRSRYGEA